MRQRGFIPIRKAQDDGHEFFLHREFGVTLWLAVDNVKITNEEVPHWGLANPVIRYARCTLTIEEE